MIKKDLAEDKCSYKRNTWNERRRGFGETIVTNTLNLICDAARCYAQATIRISVQLTNKEIRPLNICENCRREFFPYCRSENGNAEPILIDDKDIPLNFDTKTKCTCHNCNNEADVFLEILRLPVSGYYCESCAIDIKLHGIAEEVIWDSLP